MQKSKARTMGGQVSAHLCVLGTLMNELGMDIKHPKRRGEWAELRFMACVAENGLRVTKPWGDCSSYDFAVEHNGHFLRVQVKSTPHKARRIFLHRAHRNER